MRTTLDLPEKLVKTAMRVTGFKTKTGLITAALRDIVRKNKISRIKDFKGQVDLDLDLDVVRKRK